MVRQGASRVFFDVMVRYQTQRLVKDVKTQQMMVRAAILDTLSGIGESIRMVTDVVQAASNRVMGLGMQVGLARVEFEKFYQESWGSAKEVEDQIIAIGSSFGFAADSALQAGSKMAQLSTLFGAESVATGTQLGMTFGLIGGMPTEEAMKKMINLQQQTNFMMGDFTKAQFDTLRAGQKNLIMYEQTMKVMDALNSVENTSVATMSQIVNVMNNFASQAHLTGESIESMAAQSALLIEAGEEQGKGGRALRMIYARLGGNISGATDAMAQYVDVMDESGESMRPLSEIMKDLAPQWERWNEDQQQALAQQVAGNRHYVRFIKLMENHNRLLQLEENAFKRIFPAIEEKQRKLDDLAFSVHRLNVEIENEERLLSEALLPAIEAQLEVRLAYKEAVRDLIGQDETAIGKAVQGVTIFTAKLAEHLTMFAGWYDAYTGMLSGIIAMKAYGSVIRSIIQPLGQFYNMQAGMGRQMTAQNMQQLESEYALWQAKNLRQSATEKIANSEKLLRFEQEQQRDLENQIAHLKQRTLQIQQEKIDAEALEMELAAGEEEVLKQITAQLKQQSDLVDIKNKLTIEGFSIKAAEGRIEDANLRISDAQNKIMTARTMKSKRDFNLKSMTKDQMIQMLDLLRNQEIIEGKSLDRLPKEKLLMEFRKANNHLLTKYIQILEGKITTEQTDIAQDVYKMKVTNAVNKAESARATIQNELTKIQSVLNVKESEHIKIGQFTIDILERKARDMYHLAVANKTLTEAQAQERIETMAGAFADIRASEAADKLSHSMGMQSMATMGAHAAAMVTSQVIGHFGVKLGLFKDEAEAAKGQMLVMGATMAVVSVEMLVMAYNSAAAAAAMQTASQQAAAAAKTMRNFWLVTGAGVGVAIAAMLLGAKFLPDAADASFDLAENMAQASFSAQEMNEAFDDYADWTQGQVAESLERLRAQAEEMYEASQRASGVEREIMEEKLQSLYKQIALEDRVLESKEAQAHYDQIMLDSNKEIVSTMIDMARNQGIASGKLKGVAGNYGFDSVSRRTENTEDIRETLALWRDMYVQGALKDEMVDTMFEDLGYQESMILAEYIRSGRMMMASGRFSPDHEGGFQAFEDNMQLEAEDFDAWLYQSIRNYGSDVSLRKRLTGKDLKVTTDIWKDEWQETFTFIDDSGQSSFSNLADYIKLAAPDADWAGEMNNGIKQAIGLVNEFASTREELFFGGRTQAMTGELYKQVIQQGVGTLYNHQELIINNTNNFHGFFNEDSTAAKIKAAIEAHLNDGDVKAAIRVTQ